MVIFNSYVWHNQRVGVSPRGFLRRSHGERDNQWFMCHGFHHGNPCDLRSESGFWRQISWNINSNLALLYTYIHYTYITLHYTTLHCVALCCVAYCVTSIYIIIYIDLYMYMYIYIYNIYIYINSDTFVCIVYLNFRHCIATPTNFFEPCFRMIRMLWNLHMRFLTFLSF